MPTGYTGYDGRHRVGAGGGGTARFLLFGSITYQQVTGGAAASSSGAETVYEYNGRTTGAVSSTTGSTVAASVMPFYTPMWMTNSFGNTVTPIGVGPQFYSNGTSLLWLYQWSGD